MAKEIKIDLIVDDKGTAKIKGFGKTTEHEAKKAGSALERHVGKALTGIGKGFKGLTKSLFSLKGAVAAIGVGFIAKSFLDAAKETENFSVRLNILLGSVENGNKLFKDMATFAGKVPFEYNEIMGAATQLAGVMRGGVEEINKWMPLIADLAAVSGLGIRQTTEQVVRMYSAGAASADLFRERGITAMLGFQAGVTYSAEETRKMLMEQWEKQDSAFRGSTEKLAKTWTGLMSMFGDKWFQFRDAVMKSQVFEGLKQSAQGLLDVLNQMDLTAIAEKIGNAVRAISQSVITESIKMFQTAHEAFRALQALVSGIMEKYYKARADVLVWSRGLSKSGAGVVGKVGEAGATYMSEENFKIVKALRQAQSDWAGVTEDTITAYDKLNSTINKVQSGTNNFFKSVENSATKSINTVKSLTQETGQFFDYMAAEQGKDPFTLTPMIKKSPAVAWADGISSMQDDLAGMGETIATTFDVSGLASMAEKIGLHQRRGTWGQRVMPGGALEERELQSLYDIQKRVLVAQSNLAVSQAESARVGLQKGTAYNITVNVSGGTNSSTSDIALSVRRELEKMDARGV